MRAAVLFALLAVVAFGADRPGDIADDVLDALREKDTKRLEELAKRDEPDPWLVAEDLCSRGEHAAAAAFAKAAPRRSVARLPAYVERRRKAGEPERGSKLLAQVKRARRRKDLQGAFNLVEDFEVDSSSLGIASVRLVTGRGELLMALGRPGEAEKDLLAAARYAERLGWMEVAVQNFEQGAAAALEARHLDAAAQARQRALEIARTCGWRRYETVLLGNLGIVRYEMADYEEALRLFGRSRELAAELGLRRLEGSALNGLGSTYERLGRYPEALRHHQESLRICRELKDDAGIARSYWNIGNVHEGRGDYDEALRFLSDAVERFEKIEEPAGLTGALVSLATAQAFVGNHAEALSSADRALGIARQIGDKDIEGRALATVATIYSELGDFKRAVAYNREALRLFEEADARDALVALLGNLGASHADLGDWGKALGYFRRSLKVARKLGLAKFERSAVHNSAEAHMHLGHFDRARRGYEQAYELAKKMEERDGMARTLVGIGEVHLKAGNAAKALVAARKAASISRETGSASLELDSRRLLAQVQLVNGNERAALETARKGLELVPLLAGRLGEEEGASARSRGGEIFQVGLRAAVRAGDPREAFRFLEAGRAGSLLEALGGRSSFRAANIPSGLLGEEKEARLVLIAATKQYRLALKDGDVKATRQKKKALEAARVGMMRVAEKVRRTQKAGAVLYPRASELKEVQSVLRPQEALVLYDVSDEATALVVSREAARIVRLGDGKRIDAAASKSDAMELRRLAWEPLGLRLKTRRVLISPSGSLCYVSFATVDADREVVYVPSGTVYRELLGERAARGDGVLALGDPQYAEKLDASALVVMRDAKLVPLPGTRVEAERIGDVVLLGAEATEHALVQALGKRPRWRAVHLACHALVDPERPMLSSLALAPDDESDGFLSCLEVYRLQVRADLVVLSACETGKGKVYKAEGLVGLTQAFMVAGAPRVIVSLWKVDDEATRALMVRFYELWNPKDGKKGLGAAAALRKAQEHVRSQKRWEQPVYWAAWQLWGLPD